MKLILRNFIHLLKRFSGSSLINFLGLTGAIAVFLVCLIQAKYDYTYNHSFKKADDIFMTYLTYKDGQNTAHISTPLAKRIAESSALVEDYTVKLAFMCYFKQGDDLIQVDVNRVKPSFINMFEPKVIHGDIHLGLSEGNHAIITKSEALRVFGKVNAVGESLYTNMGTPLLKEQVLKIEAVINDFPENSSLDNGIYMNQEEYLESEYSFNGLYLIKPQNIQAVLDVVNAKEFWGADSESEPDVKINFISLKEYPQNAQFGNMRPRLITFFLVGVIVLLIAYINYVNFSLTMAPSRVRSLNIHRILGLGKIKQQGYIITESVLFTLVAFIGSLTIIYALSGSDLSSLFVASLNLSDNIQTILVFGLVLVFISALVGYYPARYTTSFKETEALKGGSLNAIRSNKFKDILLLFQLCTACILPILTGFVYLQHRYMVNYSWGLEKENIVYFNKSHTNQSYETLINKLRENPSIIDHTSSRFIPGRVEMGWGRMWHNRRVSLKAWPVSPNFLNFFGVEIVSGENFPQTEDGKPRVIFNQKFVDTYTPDKSPVGEEFPGFNRYMPICGVAEDVNFESLHHEIEPMGFMTISNQNKGFIFLKLAKGSPLMELIPWIESILNQESDGIVELRFLDNKLESLYTKENNQTKLISLFSLIVLIITMMGVYGLVCFNVKYKEKEIALRKVSGANEIQIVLRLNKNLLYLFSIAYVISIPTSYWLSKLWIEQFAFHIELYWWVFALGGLLTLCITLITVSVKSYRATLKNPIESLKSE